MPPAPPGEFPGNLLPLMVELVMVVSTQSIPAAP